MTSWQTLWQQVNRYGTRTEAERSYLDLQVGGRQSLLGMALVFETSELTLSRTSPIRS